MGNMVYDVCDLLLGLSTVLLTVCGPTSSCCVLNVICGMFDGVCDMKSVLGSMRVACGVGRFEGTNCVLYGVC